MLLWEHDVPTHLYVLYLLAHSTHCVKREKRINFLTTASPVWKKLVLVGQPRVFERRRTVGVSFQRRHLHLLRPLIMYHSLLLSTCCLPPGILIKVCRHTTFVDGCKRPVSRWIVFFSVSGETCARVCVLFNVLCQVHFSSIKNNISYQCRKLLSASGYRILEMIFFGY